MVRFRLKQRGLTEAQYDEMLVEQTGRCALCGKPFENVPHDPCVDHDHKTGRNRGLLHSTCNKGLGLLGDSLEGLEAAVAYLRRSEGVSL